MDFARILRFENTTIWAPKSSLSIWNTVLLEVSYLEERDIISDRGDYFQRIRGINIWITMFLPVETTENSMKIMLRTVI